MTSDGKGPGPFTFAARMIASPFASRRDGPSANAIATIAWRRSALSHSLHPVDGRQHSAEDGQKIIANHARGALFW